MSFTHCMERAAWVLLASVAMGCGGASVKPDAMSKSALTDFALKQSGDATRGRAVFLDESRVACSKCHTTDGSGAKAGPELGAIGDKYARQELIRSILEPSAVIA